MTPPDYFSKEFRLFKYLKSPQEDVKFFEETSNFINKLKPEEYKDDPTFVWPYRIEFLEQLIELSGKTVWIIDPSNSLVQKDEKEFDYIDAELIEIPDCVLFNGPSDQLDRFITQDDVEKLSVKNSLLGQSFVSSRDYYLLLSIEEEFRNNSLISVCYNLPGLPIIPQAFISYTALFYDKEWAVKYQKTLTTHLRKNSGAISAISKMV